MKYLIYFLSFAVCEADRVSRATNPLVSGKLCMSALYSIPLTSGFFTAQAVHSNDMTAKRVMKNMY